MGQKAHHLSHHILHGLVMGLYSVDVCHDLLRCAGNGRSHLPPLGPGLSHLGARSCASCIPLLLRCTTRWALPGLGCGLPGLRRVLAAGSGRPWAQ